VPGRTTPADRRLGFYTLLMSAGANWSATGDVVVGSVGEQSRLVAVAIAANPMVDHPDSPLAKYIVEQLYIQQHGKPPTESTADAGRPRDGRAAPSLVGTLTEFSKLVREFRAGTNDSELARRSVDFARRTRSAEMAWTALTLLQNRGVGEDKHRLAMADAYRQWQSTPGLEFAARYEEARQYRLAGNHDKARELFAKLHADAVKHTALIPLDDDFRQAFIQSNNGQQAWEKLWQDHAQSLVARHARRAAVMVAWQCRQLNDARLSDKLLDLALSGMSKEEQYGTSLAAVEMLWHSGGFDRADALIEPLLADERYARSPWLWRIASQIADRRGRTASCVARLERAMDIEYRHIPEKYDVEAVREQYAELMQKYQKLVDAIASLEQTPSPTLVASVVRAADRWRKLDTDPTAASQAAAKALYAVGAGDLAWDYVTTPLADKPNEASPWQATAAWLAEQGNVEMADRAYRTAFEAEATNAQILWDHAKMLERGGRFAEAQKLFQRIADSEWQPRFAGLKGQTQEILKRAKVAK
jgi:predicted Zn-dependent protease